MLKKNILESYTYLMAISEKAYHAHVYNDDSYTETMRDYSVLSKMYADFVVANCPEVDDAAIWIATSGIA